MQKNWNITFLAQRLFQCYVRYFTNFWGIFSTHDHLRSYGNPSLLCCHLIKSNHQPSTQLILWKISTVMCLPILIAKIGLYRKKSWHTTVECNKNISKFTVNSYIKLIENEWSTIRNIIYTFKRIHIQRQTRCLGVT